MGCFVLERHYMDEMEKIILVVQTYCENEQDEVLERAIEQVM